MTDRGFWSFSPVESSETSFMMTITTASTFQFLESTGIRQWSGGPLGRSVRVSEISGGDYYLKFGSSTVTAASTDSMLVLGNTVEVFQPVKPSFTCISMVSSTNVSVCVTIGYGH